MYKFVFISQILHIFSTELSTFPTARGCRKEQALGAGATHGTRAAPVGCTRTLVKSRALAPCAGRGVPCRRPGNWLGLKFRRKNARNVGFLADPVCFAPNGRPWRRVTGTADFGRVGMWRGGGRTGLAVSAPFVWRCLNSRAMTPFPHPAHRPFRGLLDNHSRCGLHTRAVTNA